MGKFSWHWRQPQVSKDIAPSVVLRTLCKISDIYRWSSAIFFDAAAVQWAFTRASGTVWFLWKVTGGRKVRTGDIRKQTPGHYPAWLWLVLGRFQVDHADYSVGISQAFDISLQRPNMSASSAINDGGFTGNFHPGLPNCKRSLSQLSLSR